jgi:hypothetical protein
MSVPVRVLMATTLLASAGVACAGELPPPNTRPIIIFSGERIQPDPQRMAEVERWMRPQLEDIEFNPNFLIRVLQESVSRYPWSTLDLEGDTADIRIAASASDAETPYMIYAHFRLMQEQGALEEWLPEAEGEEGVGIELAILNRVSDVWLLGRSVFDTQPFGPLDELLWSNEAGYLEDFVYATQGDRFEEAGAAFRAANPDREEAFRSWFQRTFERDGPGFMSSGTESPSNDADPDDADPDDTDPDANDV